MDENFYHLADTLDLPSTNTPSFLDLPRELRDEIYRYVLPPLTNGLRHLRIPNDHHIGDNPWETDWVEGKRRSFITAILRTNHQIHSEATLIL